MEQILLQDKKKKIKNIKSGFKNIVIVQAKCVELRFNDADSLNIAKDTLFNTGVIYTIYHDLGLVKDLNGAKVYYSTDEKMNALCLFF